MVASPEADPGSHPFWYAAVIGIFHAKVQHVGKNSQNYRPQHMEFLWVRWLGVVPDHSFGRQQPLLPKIGFVPDSDEFAFGFLDPSLVLRGCHLLPSFEDGRTEELLTTPNNLATEARPSGEQDDWENFYVGMWVTAWICSSSFLGSGLVLTAIFLALLIEIC